ncbi:hypothetical protein SSX86_031922 [Deinandra increscens subsp. villosa]|uniref:Cytochrome P450 n=1 Tax=Deinandra increscens subsp. villosa TaxID=3103831 RepID=A0AAP0C824_9ASTR
MEYNSLSTLVLVFLPFLLFITRKYYKGVKNLPPGPKPWPIIGNIHQIGHKPHASTAMFSKEYGPLISLRFGSKLIVVASSREAAMGILKTQDRLLSGRSIADSLHQSFMDFYFVWANDCSDHWKSLRTLTRVELFSTKAIEAQSNLRNEKLTQMLDYLDTMQGKVVKIEGVVFTTLFNTLSNLLFSKDFVDLKDEHGTSHAMKSALLKLFQNASTPCVSDFFPLLGGSSRIKEEFLDTT